MQPSEPKFAIIYFSSTDWDAMWQRPQRLASKLVQYGPVLYVNSLGLRTPLLRDLRRILHRVAAALSQTPTPLPSPGLTVLSPLIYLPFPRSAWAARINGRLLDRSLAGWIKRLEGRPLILWIGIPSPAVMEAVKHVNARLRLYDCIDNFAAFHKNRPDIVETERRLVASAQIVFATSAELFERMKEINPHTFLIANAVDLTLFHAETTGPAAAPRDIAECQRPILGYVGEIAEWFDCELVRDLAVQNPDWSIALIGDIHSDVAALLAQPNVHYLGPKNYELIPSYVGHFDACLVPFKVNALTNAVNPIKIYEYLAMGKPVVSTPLREVQRFSEVIEIADPADFSNAVKRALAKSDDSSVQQRLQVARNNTWDIRTAEIVRILADSIKGSA
ncbi:MAG: glycosyltransferase [Chloroflexi bacterium]|nr:glycosyltransferase [Chloroflexota bacterium]